MSYGRKRRPASTLHNFTNSIQGDYDNTVVVSVCAFVAVLPKDYSVSQQVEQAGYDF